ncbi:hypothetical protein SprV_0802550800 [Sparganum proliferum]
MVYGHVKQQNHNFAFEKARVIGRANDKMARLMLESWSSTGTLRRAIDLHPAYQTLRTRLESVRTGPSGQSSKVTRMADSRCQQKVGEKPSGATTPTSPAPEPTTGGFKCDEDYKICVPCSNGDGECSDLSACEQTCGEGA